MGKPTLGRFHPSAVVSGQGRAQASRFDRNSGIREDVHFFGPDRLKLFGCMHTPVGRPIGGVVICSTLEVEAQKNYRREVLLARSLSAHGLAVQRFHYRGCGNSDGDSRDARFETMREDALAAAEWLKNRAGVTNLAFVGTRWGALIAASAAARCQRAPLGLWEPAVDGSRYFREILRSRLMQDLRQGQPVQPSILALVEKLRQAGFVDVLGYRIDQALYDSAIGRTLAEELGRSLGSVLLAQIARSQDLFPEYAALLAWCRRAGISFETHIVEEEIAWGFFDDRWGPDEERPGTKRLIEVTRDWLLRQFASRA